MKQPTRRTARTLLLFWAAFLLAGALEAGLQHRSPLLGSNRPLIVCAYAAGGDVMEWRHDAQSGGARAASAADMRSAPVSATRLHHHPAPGALGLLAGSLRHHNTDQAPVFPALDKSSMYRFASSGTTASEQKEPKPAAHTMSSPRVVNRSPTSLSLEWDYPASVASDVEFNLVVNGDSVYTGPQTSFTLTALAPNSCLRVQVAAFLGGVWGPLSVVKAASTPASDAVDMRKLSDDLHQDRVGVWESALQLPNMDDCPLLGYSEPSYIDGGNSFLEFLAASTYVTEVGAAAEKTNCHLVRCSPKSKLTFPLDADLGKILKMATSHKPPFKFIDRFVQVPAGSHMLQYADPRSPLQKIRQPLIGCRARQGQDAAHNPKDPSAFGSKCFDVRCSSSLTQLFLCASDPESAEKWVNTINRATFPSRTFSHYEVTLKLAPAMKPIVSSRREKPMGVFEDAALREAWTLSFLTSLAEAKVSPAFPRFLGHTQCKQLPPKFSRSPTATRTGAGVLPPTLPGASLPQSVTSAQDDGVTEAMWSALIMDTYSADLGEVLDGYKDALIPIDWVRAIFFQIIYGVGVAHHAFGFHHNDLMRLRNIKLVQVPFASDIARPFTCFSVRPSVLSGQELLVPEFPSFEEVLPYLFDQVDSSDACGGGDSGASATRFSATSDASVVDSDERSSWCIPFDDADGLVVKLHNFESSALARKQLEWWRAGYTFPNSAWRDDLRDFALAACGIIQEKVAGGLTSAAAGLCAAMQDGTYKKSPLEALQHEFFDVYVPVTEVPSSQRRTFSYSSATKPKTTKPSGQAGGNGGAGGDGDGDGDGDSNGNGEDRPGVGPPTASAAAILKAITLKAPTVTFQGPEVVLVRWNPHPETHNAPAPTPYTYSLLLNGISVYSGNEPVHTLRLTPGKCASVSVSAFYLHLGWTPRSPETPVIPC